MRFTVTCIGADPLDLGSMLERLANEQWLPAHVTHWQCLRWEWERVNATATDAVHARGVVNVFTHAATPCVANPIWCSYGPLVPKRNTLRFDHLPISSRLLLEGRNPQFASLLFRRAGELGRQ
jgi:hypothetical protein